MPSDASVLYSRKSPPSALAEASQLRVSRGFGVHYLPLYVMEAKGLLQKQAVNGRSVTPMALYPTQPPQVPRMRVAKDAARGRARLTPTTAR